MDRIIFPLMNNCVSPAPCQRTSGLIFVEKRGNCHPEPKAKGLLRMVSQYQYFVYIMTNKSGTLYTGVSNNLERRVYEHKHHLIDGFTKKYKIGKLVYFEETNDINAAISREKQIKGWVRKKKIALIESINPHWKDLCEDFF